jgi:predicted ferric reductase
MSLHVVGALWIADRGGQDLTSGRTALTSAGRLAGLVGADLLLVQVLLMARIPWVERSYGQDELVRRHRLVGFASFDLMLAHIGLVTAGYAATDRLPVPGETWRMLTTFRGMVLAVVGTGLLVLVVGTSIRAARRRLRYEAWHLLHLYAYLGVGFSVPHEIWTGSDLGASPLAAAYWWTAYAGAAGSVLVFRVGLPLWRSARHRLVVDRVVREGANSVSVYLRGRRLDRLPVAAGQFFVWRFLHGSGWARGHPFSLSAAPNDRRLRITVKDLGDGSARLAELPPGTRVLMEGPYGRLTRGARRRRKVTLVASGVGITPLRALLEELRYRPGEAVLLYRARSEAEFLFRAELDLLAARRGVRVVYLPGPRVPDRNSWLPAGAATFEDDEALRRLVPDIEEHDVYVCGPQPWTEAVVAAARAAWVPAGQIHTERFAW